MVYITTIVNTPAIADIYMLTFYSSRENSLRPSSNATAYTDLSNIYSTNETATMKATEQGPHSACKYLIFKKFMIMYDEKHWI